METTTDYDTFKLDVASITSKKQQSTRKQEWILSRLRRCSEQPILWIKNCKAEDFMEWLQSIQDSKGQRLCKSSYGNKIAALHHLFRCHPQLDGFPPKFEQELKVLKKGFFRILATEMQDEGKGAIQEGKKPMSYELYEKCCAWFLQSGTQQGIFCHCFLVLTWNLMCRSNNTTRILFEHLSFEWDHVKIMFAQQKNDTHGYTAKYPRHVYANPYNATVCPIFALSLYFGTFGTNCKLSDALFPGRSQYKRFVNGLMDVIKMHEDEVCMMGYDGAKDIGAHSIRKGATKWLSGQPGGPSAMSICIRGGWSLGGVKDVYMTYEAEGDAFCGRMLALLPLLKSEFAASPPELAGLSKEEVNDCVKKVFPSFSGIGGYSTLICRCLARIAFSQDVVMSWPVDHIIRQQNPLFLDNTIRLKLLEKAKVCYPWELAEEGDGSIKFGSGIPPHVALMVTQTKLLHDFRNFASGYDDRMTNLLNKVFDDRNVIQGGMSEQRIHRIMNQSQESFYGKLIEEIKEITSGNATSTDRGTGMQSKRSFSRTKKGYSPHYHGGKFWRLPEDFVWPKGTARDIWRRWNLGDDVNGVPPLSILTSSEFRFLDKPNERPARKTYSDLKYVCTYVREEAEKKGIVCPEEMDDEKCIEIFNQVATVENGLIAGKNRKSQCQWRTAIRRIQFLRRTNQKNDGMGELDENRKKKRFVHIQDTSQQQKRNNRPENQLLGNKKQASATIQKSKRQANKISDETSLPTKRRTKRQRVRQDTSNLFATAFKGIVMTPSMRKRDNEIATEVAIQMEECAKEDGERQIKETGMFTKNGRQIGRCAVVGCQLHSLELIHRCDVCKKHIHTICAEPFSKPMEDVWCCGCRPT